VAETSSFPGLLTRYRAVFFDAYGVLKTDAGWIEGAPEVLARVGRDGPPAWVVSNDASRVPEVLAATYDGLVRPEQLVTSGGLAAAWLRRERPGARVGYLGPPTCAGFLDAAGGPVRPFAELDDPGWAEVVAVMDEAGFDWPRELNRIVNLARDRPGTALLAPNPDRLFARAGGRVGLAAGSLAALLEAALGRPVPHLGKPGAAIFAEGLRRARAVLGPDLAPGEVLMVGDTLETDVRGARAAGLDVALVLTGNTPAAGWRDAVARSGDAPTWVVPDLSS